MKTFEDYLEMANNSKENAKEIAKQIQSKLETMFPKNYIKAKFDGESDVVVTFSLKGQKSYKYNFITQDPGAVIVIIRGFNVNGEPGKQLSLTAPGDGRKLIGFIYKDEKGKEKYMNTYVPPVKGDSKTVVKALLDVFKEYKTNLKKYYDI